MSFLKVMNVNKANIIRRLLKASKTFSKEVQILLSSSRI